MQGIELSRRFFTDIVRPWLAQTAPDLRYSAMLGGYGSELLGFDDAVSRDHNWGPRVHIIVDRHDFHAYAQRLVDDFAAVAPERFLDEPIGWRSRPHPAANGPESRGLIAHGVEVHTLEAVLEGHFALRSVEALEPLAWLGFAEHKLLAFTSGAVFADDGGRLDRARSLLAYFPDDIWFYKIACQWGRIAEEQAFVGRAGQVGDDLGSRVIAARLARDVMGLGFLLERRYAPYAKWFGSAFARLPIASRLLPPLDEALRANSWQARGDALAEAYRILAERHNAIGVGPFTPLLGPYHDRPFTTINADDAVAAARGAIRDPSVQSLPTVGALDQVSDLTPLLADAGLSQAVARALYP